MPEYMMIYAGQVHRAKLKGQEVVIKVQRPGLKDLFDIDLKNLRVRNLICRRFPFFVIFYLIIFVLVK